VANSVYGIVHLYRDAKETPSLTVDDHPLYLKGSSAAARRPALTDSPHTLNTFPDSRDSTRPSSSNRRTGRGLDDGESLSDDRLSLSPRHRNNLSDEDCSVLCILAVPSYLSPADFLGFVGEDTRDQVSHFRMIKTARANRYMVLMKFRDGKKAREWQKEWNGKVFNSMEVCDFFFLLL
jgi:BRCA1-associated protein